jgi:hypothetical protein
MAGDAGEYMREGRGERDEGKITTEFEITVLILPLLPKLPYHILW